MDRAAETGSSAVVITKSGEPILDWTDGGGHRRTETMSVTKLVVATVVGASVCKDDRALLDTSVAEWIPEWKDDERSTISLRILLGHRSGLRAVAPPDFVEIADSYAAAAGLPLDGHPTEAFVYNNLAFNALGLVLRRALGDSLAEVAERTVFTPLGITDWHWLADAAGNTRCHFGFACRANDLAKIGQLYVEPAGIIPDWWPDRAMRSGLSYYPKVAWIRAGVTSELADKWRTAGIDIAAVEGILDREMDFDEFSEHLHHELANQVRVRGLKQWEGSSGPIVGYGHDGDGGQQLIVYPELRGVAVRFRENLETGAMWSAFPGDAQEVLTNAVR